MLGLYDDNRFPGRSLLVLKDHEEDLSALSTDVAAAFVADLQIAARAIMHATGARRMNYAFLGNVEAHLHAHLVPRGLATDAVPGQAPWADPRPAARLDPGERARLVDGIAGALGLTQQITAPR